MRRLTRREQLKHQIANLDTFPKVIPEYKEDVMKTSTSGGLTTIVTVLLIAFLVVSEVFYYRTIDVKYAYKVDHDFKTDMNLTLDVTIPMFCDYLGADVVDVTGHSSDTSHYLKYDPAHFELSPKQLQWIEETKKIKDEEGAHGLDSLSRFLHQSAMRHRIPAAELNEFSTQDNACRIHGTIPVRKLSGNFHITAGKSVHHNRGHAHMLGNVPTSSFNFSHRIDRFSFADGDFGSQTMDGDLKIASIKMAMYQYFIDIVPTTTRHIGDKVGFRSNQYSVTEQFKDLSRNEMGALPGLFFRYDLEAISVDVFEEHRSLFQFVIRLCGIIGGVFATSGLIHMLVTGLVDSLRKKVNVLPTS